MIKIKFFIEIRFEFRHEVYMKLIVLLKIYQTLHKPDENKQKQVCEIVQRVLQFRNVDGINGQVKCKNEYDESKKRTKVVCKAAQIKSGPY